MTVDAAVQNETTASATQRVSSFSSHPVNTQKENTSTDKFITNREFFIVYNGYNNNSSATIGIHHLRWSIMG